MKLKFEAFALSGRGAGWKLGNPVRTSLPPFRPFPQSVLLPVQEVTLPHPAVSLASAPHLVHRFFPDPSPLELVGPVTDLDQTGEEP